MSKRPPAVSIAIAFSVFIVSSAVLLHVFAALEALRSHHAVTKQVIVVDDLTSLRPLLGRRVCRILNTLLSVLVLATLLSWSRPHATISMTSFASRRSRAALTRSSCSRPRS